MLNSVFAPRKRWIRFEKVVGAVLRRERLLKEMSLEEVASKAKTFPQSLSKFEGATMSIPAMMLLRVAKVLGLTPTALGQEIDGAVKHLETLDIIVVDAPPEMGDPMFGYPEYEDPTQSAPEEEQEEEEQMA